MSAFMTNCHVPDVGPSGGSNACRSSWPARALSGRAEGEIWRPEPVMLPMQDWHCAASVGYALGGQTEATANGCSTQRLDTNAFLPNACRRG